MSCGGKSYTRFSCSHGDTIQSSDSGRYEPIHSHHYPGCQMQMFAVGCITKLAGHHINNTFGTGWWSTEWDFWQWPHLLTRWLKWDSALKRFISGGKRGTWPKHFTRLNQRSHQLCVIVSVCVCLCLRTGIWFDWVAGVGPSLTTEHLSVFMHTLPGGDDTASVTAWRTDKLFPNTLSHSRLCVTEH